MKHCFAFLVCAALVLTMSSTANAYPWMIRHDYTNCMTCHADPSGGGVLTPYGRAQSAILLSSTYGAPVEDPGHVTDFLFGVAPTPDWLEMQAWFRNGYIWNDAAGSIVDSRLLQMVADVGAHVSLGAFRAGATLGYNVADAANESQAAWITPASSAGNLISREYWAGASLNDDSILIRAGRINVPFGIRNIEHTAWVRLATRTDISQDQQHGVAVAYSNDRLRAEVMGIAGNFQVGPDAYRERGYSGYAELALAPRVAVGVSSLVTHANADILTQQETTRQAHGAFVRAAPWQPLVLLAEFDALLAQTPTTSTAPAGSKVGYVGQAQFDLEPIQGLHGIVSGEMMNQGGSNDKTNLGLWLGVAWFAYSHVDARFDVIRRGGSGLQDQTTFLLQLNLYL